jgi:hypothetical protein
MSKRGGEAAQPLISGSSAARRDDAPCVRPSRLDELMSENHVYKIWGHLLVDKELREARQNGLIEWFNLRKGPHYTELQIINYFLTRVRSACDVNKVLQMDGAIDDSKSSANGSAKSKKAALSIVTGTTQLPAELVEKALEF